MNSIHIQKNSYIIDEYATGESPYAQYKAAQSAGKITGETDVANRIAIVDNADLQLDTFRGQVVPLLCVIVCVALVGDADLNGFVNGDDFTLISNGVNSPGSGLKSWMDGDFNNTGTVTQEDLDAYAAVFKLSSY